MQSITFYLLSSTKNEALLFCTLSLRNRPCYSCPLFNRSSSTNQITPSVVSSYPPRSLPYAQLSSHPRKARDRPSPSEAYLERNKSHYKPANPLFSVSICLKQYVLSHPTGKTSKPICPPIEYFNPKSRKCLSNASTIVFLIP